MDLVGNGGLITSDLLSSPRRSVPRGRTRIMVLAVITLTLTLVSDAARAHVMFFRAWEPSYPGDGPSIDYLYNGPPSWQGGTYYERQGDIVIGWQGILWADGHSGSCADDPGYGIDGYFGPITTQRTKNWQTFYGITSDGIVGAATWKAAYNGLRQYAEADGNVSQQDYEWQWFAYQGLKMTDNRRNFFGTVTKTADGYWGEWFLFFADWKARWMSHPDLSPCAHG